MNANLDPLLITALIMALTGVIRKHKRTALIDRIERYHPEKYKELYHKYGYILIGNIIEFSVFVWKSDVPEDKDFKLKKLRKIAQILDVFFYLSIGSFIFSIIFYELFR